MARRYQYQAKTDPILMQGTGVPTRQFVGGSGAAIGISVTAWFEIAECALSTNTTTETNSGVKARLAGTYSQMTCRVNTNTITASSTLTFRKNSVNGNLTITIPTSTTGKFADETHTDTVLGNGTESINYQLVTGGSGTSLSLGHIGITFTASGQTAKRIGAAGALNESTASDTLFPGYGAFAAPSVLTEANMKSLVRVNGVIRNLNVAVTANGRATTSTILTRKNAADGNLTVSIGAAATGIFEDTLHQDAVVSGDLINFKLTTGTGVGTLTVQHIITDLTTANSTYLFVSGPSSTQSFGPALTRLMAIGGDGIATTEANIQMLADRYLNLSNLWINITANTLTASSTFTLRRNTASNTNLSVTIGSGATGIFEDSAQSDVVSPTDLLNYRLITGGTGTTITPFGMGMKVTESVPIEWDVPLSEPVRSKLPLPIGAYPEYRFLTVPSIEIVTLDKWFVQLSEPVRVKPPVAANLPDIEVGELGTPPIVSFSWYNPLSEPVRVKSPIPIGGEPFLFQDIQELTLVSKWFVPLSEPVRVKPPLSIGAMPSSFMGQPPVVSFSWYNSLSEPVRTKIPLTVGARPSLVTDFSEFTLLTKWFVPLSEPVRVKKPLPVGATPFLFIDPKVLTLKEATTVDRWFIQFSEPVKTVPPMRIGAMPHLAFSLPEVVSLDKWFVSLSEPVRVKSPLPVAAMMSFSIDPKFIFVRPTSELDSWFISLSQPVLTLPPIYHALISSGLTFLYPSFVSFKPVIFVLPPLPRFFIVGLGAREFIVSKAKKVTIVYEGQRSFEVPAKGRSYVAIGGEMVLTTKDPNSVEDFQFDWTKELGGDPIVSSTWIVPVDLTMVSNAFTVATTTIRLSSGTLGQVDLVTNRITTQSGQVKDFSMQITIKDA